MNTLRVAFAALAFGAGLLGESAGIGAPAAHAQPFYDCAHACYSYCQQVEGHFPDPSGRCMTACERQTCPSY